MSETTTPITTAEVRFYVCERYPYEVRAVTGAAAHRLCEHRYPSQDHAKETASLDVHDLAHGWHVAQVLDDQQQSDIEKAYDDLRNVARRWERPLAAFPDGSLIAVAQGHLEDAESLLGRASKTSERCHRLLDALRRQGIVAPEPEEVEVELP